MDLVERPAEGRGTRHPWETVRAGFFLRVLEEAGLVGPGARILDVGAGDGWFASRLADRGAEVTCWDTGYADHPPPADPRLRCTAAAPEGRFPLVLAMDVAEHVEDDRAFLAGIVRDRLATGGHLLLSVPTWPILFSEHDRRLRHHRRYSPAAARALVAAAGLEVRRSGGLFHSLLLVRALQRLAPDRRGAPPAHAGEWRAGPFVTGAVAAALSAEARFGLWCTRLGVSLPGLSWYALCRKP